MRLLVDHSAACNQAAGIGRYGRNVVPAAIRELAGLPTFAATIFYAPAGRTASLASQAIAALPTGVPLTVRRSPIGRRRLDQLWFQTGRAVGAARLVGAADLVYSPDFLAPPLAGAPSVVTVHDLAFLVCPERAPDELVRYLRRAVSAQVKRAAGIAVVSDTSRRDLIERLGISPERVAVVPNGVEARFFAAAPPDQSTRRRLRLPGAYLLAVGTIEPRKNHRAAFAALRVAGKALDLPLVVAGRPGWQAAPILEDGADLAATGRVRFLGHVAEADLPALYAGAAALVYPSWYEGFGLPVVEALAAGTPVVVSPAPALVEVGGPVVEVAEGWDGEAVAEAIGRALRPSSRTAGARDSRRARAAGYSWEAAGRALARHLRACGGRER